MQAAGMLRGTGAAAVSLYLLFLGTLLIAFIGDNAHALPLQVLPNIPGYIPVFIRNGDQPLEEINPGLAEAFHEKQSLENVPVDHLDHDSGHSESIHENRPSYDEEDEDDGELDAGARRKGTIYLIGVRQSNGNEANGEEAGIVSKIALPFELLEREATKVNSEGNKDRTKPEDTWIEEPNKNHGRKPIALSKEAVIKVGGLPVEVKDLEKLAAEVEKEETRPNDLYDSSNTNDRGESARRARRPIPNKSNSATSKENMKIRSHSDDDDDDGDFIQDTRLRPAQDPKEFRPSKSVASEPLLRPRRDPKESRPDEAAMDFMEEVE